MAKPPPTPPSSDIAGVDRDARVQDADRDTKGQSAEAIQDAADGSAARPPGTLDEPHGNASGSGGAQGA